MVFIKVVQRGVLEFAPYDWQTLRAGNGQICTRHSPYLFAPDFSNSPVWNIEFDELYFSPSLKSQFRNPFHWIRIVKNVISKWTKMKFSQVSISLIHRNLKKINFKLEKISSWFQTGKNSSSSNSIFQTGELEKSGKCLL